MIFATVGTQLPFPRLMEALNAIAPRLEEPIIAQVGGDAEAADWPHLDIRPNLAPADFEATFREARIVVGHAGIGTILSAKKLGKPLVLLPRQHALGEHRNDHQLATAQQVADLPGMYVAWDAADLGPLLSRTDLTPAAEAESPSHAALLARIESFINS